MSQQCINFKMFLFDWVHKSLYLHVHNRPSLVHKGPSQVCKKSSEVHMTPSQFLKRSYQFSYGTTLGPWGTMYNFHIRDHPYLFYARQILFSNWCTSFYVVLNHIKRSINVSHVYSVNNIHIVYMRCMCIFSKDCVTLWSMIIK